MDVKLDWGVLDITLPEPGEGVSPEVLSIAGEWIRHVAYQGLTGGAMGLEKQIEQMHKALIVNAVLAYLLLAGPPHTIKSINKLRTEKGMEPIAEPEPL